MQQSSSKHHAYRCRELARLLSLLSLLAVLMLSSFAAGSEPRLAVYTEQSFPLNYTESGEDDAPIVGFATKLVEAVLREAGIEYDIQMVPWVRAMQAIDHYPNVVVYSMTRTAEREPRYHWVGEILPLHYYLYGLKERAEVLPRSLEEAAAFSVGVNRDDVVHKYLAANGFQHLVLVNSSAHNLHMLRRGRIDFFPFSEFGVGMFNKRHGFDPGDIIGLVKLDEISTGMYMALSKSTSDEMVLRLSDAYARVQQSGTHKSIMDPLRELFRQNEVDRVD